MNTLNSKLNLSKGVQKVAASLLPTTLGPVLTYNAFMNQDHELFYIVLTFGVAFMFLAIFLFIKGILEITNALLGPSKKKSL